MRNSNHANLPEIEFVTRVGSRFVVLDPEEVWAVEDAVLRRGPKPPYTSLFIKMGVAVDVKGTVEETIDKLRSFS